MITNTEVDVLGRWEAGPGAETPPQIMMSILRKGVMQDWFVPNAVMYQEEDQLTIYNPNEEKIVVNIELRDIRDPVAFQRKPGDDSPFNRVIIFSVAESGHYNFNNIFIALQCLRDDPSDLVEKLIEACDLDKLRRSGEAPAYASVGRRIQPATPTDYADARRTSAIQSKSPKVVEGKSPAVRTESFGLNRPSVIYDLSEDQVQKDSILLNYCTDDIEKLCRELRTSRDEQEGFRAIDSYKAIEFTHVFQKIKLAFNLLARLNNHIRDPSASDVVHSLMPPLAFLMDAGHDLFEEEVQKDVVSPLLTSKTTSFLRSCLSSKELLVWEGCGPNWTVPRINNEGDPMPYRPLFSDGWSPGYLDIAEEDAAPRSTAPRSRESPYRSPVRNGSTATESDFGSDSISLARFPDMNVNEKEIFRDKLMEREALIALVTHPWRSHNNKELSVEKGEYVEVLNNDKKWWRCRNSANKIGYVPFTLLTTLVAAEKAWEKDQREKDEREREEREKEERRREEREREERRREEREREERKREDREREERRREEREKEENRREEREREERKREERERELRESRRLPPRSPSTSPDRGASRLSPTPSLPPPPPPQPLRRRESDKKTNAQKPTQQRKDRVNSIQSTYSMQDELKDVLSFLSKEKSKHLVIHKTRDVYVDQRSTAREVQQWLNEKDFSERAQTKLDGMDGKQLLAIQRKDLESIFGKEEGGRLDSQITLSRNHTKYTQGKNSELRAILEKAKRRAETTKETEDTIDKYFDSDEATV